MGIFFNTLGEFQWASVAAIVAAAGAIISFVFSLLSYSNSVKALKHQKEIDQKKIDADIISKSRLDWLNVSKKLTAEFLSDSLMIYPKAINVLRCHKYYEGWENEKNKSSAISHSEIKEKQKRLIEMNKKYTYELSEMQQRLISNNLLIGLSFIDYEQKDDIVEAFNVRLNHVRELVAKVSSFENLSVEQWDNLINEASEHSKSNSKELEKIRYMLIDYTNSEWEKIKRGK